MTGTARLVLVLAVGAIATLLIAFALGASASETLQLTLYAGLGAVGAGIVGGTVLRALRRRSIAVQMIVVSLTALTAVAIGVATAARLMFISTHDLSALIIVLGASSTIGVVVAFLLGRHIADASRWLGDATRRIGDGEFDTKLDRPPTIELEELASQIEQMSQRLDGARRSERAMDASRRELIAWVSHDLRTPLADIRAMAEALSDGMVDAGSVKRYYSQMCTEADRLSGLVDDLFELSRIQGGALRLEVERVSLSEIVSDALASADALARAKNIRLEAQMTSDPPELEVSTPEMVRVLLNLLGNAIRHTPSDGTVWVEAGTDAAHAYVSVADTCGGISETDIGRVFNMAFRGDVARTPELDRGSGLGLTIARGLVEAHKGHIAVRNDGPGCRFTVHLPLPDAT